MINYLKRLNKKIPNYVDWIIVILIIIFCFFSFNHGDLLITSTHGKDLVECILTGDFFSFYDYTQSTAMYSIILYWVFAMWSIPVVIVYKMLGISLWGVVEYNAIPFPVLMWYKLLPTVFYFGIAYILYKILVELNGDKQAAKLGAFLFISSPLAIFSQFIFGQYDSIGLFFTILALYMYIRKKYIGFSICISVAITFKLFALFVFIPLVLLFEKRFWHILKHMGIGMSLYIITSLLFINSQGYKDALAFSGGMIERLVANGIATQWGMISLFVLIMMLVCVYAYVKKIETQEEYYAWTVYISFCVYAAFFVFVLWHPQWIIYLAPFIILAMYLHENANASIILQIVMYIGYLGVVIGAFVNNVDANLLVWGMFRDIYATKAPLSLSKLYYVFGDSSQSIYYSLFGASILVLMIFYLHVLNKKNTSLTTVKDMKIEHKYIYVRSIMSLMFIVPALYYLFR